jgi:kelch-like protein 9/13
MFTSGMKESAQAEIELKGVNATGLAKVIEIVYASPSSSVVTSLWKKIETTNNKNSDDPSSYYELFEIVAAANHLQCFLVIDHCEKSLISQLDFSNFNYFIQMANMYNMHGLLSHIDDFITQNLARVVYYNRDSTGIAQTGDFFLKSLSYDQLLKCLADDRLRIKEIDLFYVVWKWIYLNLFGGKRNKLNLNRFDLNKKLRTISTSLSASRDDSTGNNDSDTLVFGLKKIEVVRSLLKHVRYNQISAVDLINRVQTVNKIMLSDSCLRKMVLTAVNYQLAPHMYPLVMGQKVRCPVRTLLMIGGREINPVPTLHDACLSLNEIVTSDGAHTNLINTATVVTTLPNVLSHMQCVMLESSGYLYVLGGCLSQCVHGESATNTVLAYDPRLNKWTYLSSMIEKRAYFYACALIVNGIEHVFAFGGKNRDGNFF